MLWTDAEHAEMKPREEDIEEDEKWWGNDEKR